MKWFRIGMNDHDLWSSIVKTVSAVIQDRTVAHIVLNNPNSGLQYATITTIAEKVSHER